MERQLVEHLVFFSYIQACCLRSCLLVCLCTSQKNCRVANSTPVRNWANILQTGQTYCKNVTSTLAWFAQIGRFANWQVRQPDPTYTLEKNRPLFFFGLAWWPLEKVPKGSIQLSRSVNNE